jgi:hypothetical protein
MALDFPNSPSPGNTHVSGDRSWQYDGNSWVSTTSVGYTGSLGSLVVTANSITSSNDITPTFTGYSSQYDVTALAVAANVLVPTGTSVTNGYRLLIRFKDNGTARALTWTTTSGGYRIVGTTLPTTTVATKTMYVGCVYNSAASFWDVIAVSSEV